MVVDLDKKPALISSFSIAPGPNQPFAVVAEHLDPVLYLRTGPRDLAKRGGWTIFFDRMQEKASQLHTARIAPTRATAFSKARRATLSLDGLEAGPFAGELRWTFYAGQPFVLMEAVMSTQEDGVAYLFDMGMVCRGPLPERMIWNDTSGERVIQWASLQTGADTLKVGKRAVVASYNHGSLGVFPPPHRFFYPLDFSDNLRNFWSGPSYGEETAAFGFGIRHDPCGDNRFVPWFNGPPGTEQEMGMFLYVSDRAPGTVLDEVARLTRNDQFAPLPGHKVFTSHYHVEHTQEVLDAQKQSWPQDQARAIESATGQSYMLPRPLEEPGFVKVFKQQGIDIAHLAEFHFGRTPGLPTDERLRQLAIMHAECERLSAPDFLLLPGEEPNVHLGGHWISLFPRPVYWVLNRPADVPFVAEDSRLGRVYHVGGKEDVLELLRLEKGLAWTAHPRIKSSTGFPDAYREEAFFKSDRFLGAAWKAMPADLSQPRLGGRVLDLLDDMANWGEPKYVLGEVDVFKVRPDHEQYAHMNVNYLRLDKIPSFAEGWQPVLDALRGGAFFVTTGEVLIPEFTVNGVESGATATVTKGQLSKLRLDMQWTFPLDRVEVISGDGTTTRRTEIDLSRTEAFGSETLQIEHDLSGQRWVRVEVWDIATNGAFTQPVWLR